MDRREFLESIGIGAAFVLTASCLQSCKSNENNVTPSGNIDFNIDLSASSNAALKNAGGFVVTQGVVIAKTSKGEYVAATNTCSHEGNKAVGFNNSDQFQCSVHGALFDLAGKGLNANGSGGLKIYKTSLTGTTLRVFS